MVTANEAQFPLFRPDLENATLEDCKPAFASMMPMGEPGSSLRTSATSRCSSPATTRGT